MRSVLRSQQPDSIYERTYYISSGSIQFKSVGVSSIVLGSIRGALELLLSVECHQGEREREMKHFCSEFSSCCCCCRWSAAVLFLLELLKLQILKTLDHI